MNSKEALEKLGNVEVAVTTIRSGITHFKTLKEQYAKEFEVLEKELLLFVRDIKPFDVYEEQYKKLEKENQELKEEKDFAWEKSEENWVKYQKECDDVTEYILVIEKKNEELIRYEKALEILKDVVSLNCDKTLETERQLLRLTQEEYELLKSVLEEK